MRQSPISKRLFPILRDCECLGGWLVVGSKSIDAKDTVTEEPRQRTSSGINGNEMMAGSTATAITALAVMPVRPAGPLLVTIWTADTIRLRASRKRTELPSLSFGVLRVTEADVPPGMIYSAATVVSVCSL